MWGSGWRGHPADCQGGDVSHSSARRDLSAKRLGTGSRASGRAIAEGSTHRELIRHGNTRRALHVGHVVHRVRARDCDRPDPAPSSPVSDTASSQSGPIDHPRVVGTRGKIPTFPGRLPRPQEVTRWVRGGRYRARGQRRVPHSDLRVASWPIERHGRAARALAGGSLTFSEIKSR